MAIEITVPRLGWSMDEGVFVEWLVGDGDFVSAGDMLFVLEGEKAAQEIESFDSGILRLASDSPTGGETVAVGQVLAFLVADGEETPPLPTPLAATASENVTASHRNSSPPQEPASCRTADSSTLKSSPRARRVARELGVDWRLASGSGRTGRIRESDVRALATDAADTPVVTPSNVARLDAPVTQIRRAIAVRMSQGVHLAAPVTLHTEVDATTLVGARNALKATGMTPIPSYGDMILYLTARQLRSHEILRGQWGNDAISIPSNVHINIAVHTDAGLMAPVIRDCDQLSLSAIAEQSADLAHRAQQQSVAQQDLDGGTFTITNLGAFGIDRFTPIINLPQSAVLGIGVIDQRPQVVNNRVAPRWTLTLSLTVDHRVMDGTPAAAFLADLRAAIEQAAF